MERIHTMSPSPQNLLEPKRLSGVGSVGPVMMLPVGPSEEQSATPSYQMVNRQ